VRKADNHVTKSGNPNFLETSRHLGPVMGPIYFFFLTKLEFSQFNEDLSSAYGRTDLTKLIVAFRKTWLSLLKKSCLTVNNKAVFVWTDLIIFTRNMTNNCKNHKCQFIVL